MGEGKGNQCFRSFQAFLFIFSIVFFTISQQQKCRVESCPAWCVLYYRRLQGVAGVQCADAAGAARLRHVSVRVHAQLHRASRRASRHDGRRHSSLHRSISLSRHKQSLLSRIFLLPLFFPSLILSYVFVLSFIHSFFLSLTLSLSLLFFSRALLLQGATLLVTLWCLSVYPVVHGRPPLLKHDFWAAQAILSNFCFQIFFFFFIQNFFPRKFFSPPNKFSRFHFLCISRSFMPSWVLKKISP